MEIPDIDKTFISKYEQIDLDYSVAKARLVVFGIFFILSLIMIPINLSDQNLRGADNCVVGLIVFVPFLIYLGYSFICTKDLFVKELGMNERNAKQKYDFLKNEVGLFPFIRQICLLNPSAKTRQLELLKKWYVVNADVVNTYVYDIEYDEKTVKEELDKLNNKEISVRNEFVHKLFKLAILDDGIHNDEWNLLMEMLKKLNFNKNFIAFYKKKYRPLRTEFDEEEFKNTESKQEPHVYILKPYYDILGLQEGTSDEEIKKAYHALALKHHPDLQKNANRVEECETMMAKINEAYEIIRNS